MSDNKINVLTQLKESINKFDNKDFSIYFFTMDSKGNPSAGIAEIYQHVKLLNEMGYKAVILHEKNDYQSVAPWLGEDYSKLPHQSIESQELKVGLHDFIIIPELFANAIEQLRNLPSKRIVLCQSYDYIFELLGFGKTWSDFGVTDCITTSEKQKEYISTIFNNINISVIPTSIPNYFKPSDKPKKPIVAIHTRDPRTTIKLVKTFYLKYPHLKFVSFRDLRGLSRENFAAQLRECCLSVWVDEVAGFGTFPLESIKSNVPVIAKVPNLIPEWFNDKNGLWTYDIFAIPDLVGQYFQAWMEDNEPQEMYGEMEKIKPLYTIDTQKEILKTVYENFFTNRKIELTEILNKQETFTITSDTEKNN